MAVEPQLINDVFKLNSLAINDVISDKYDLSGQKLVVRLPVPLGNRETLKLTLTYQLNTLQELPAEAPIVMETLNRHHEPADVIGGEDAESVPVAQGLATYAGSAVVLLSQEHVPGPPGPLLDLATGRR